MNFSFDEMIRLRVLRFHRKTMAEICAAFPRHTREALVEAIDALLRHGEARVALDHVNRVLEMQAQGVPLINGWEAWEIEGPRISMRGRA